MAELSRRSSVPASKPKAVAAAADALIDALAAAPHVRAYAEISIEGRAELTTVMRAVGRLSMALEIYDRRPREWAPALLPLMPEASSTASPDHFGVELDG